METIIIMIVVALLSRVFSGNKKAEKPPKDAMPPFSNPKKPAQTEYRPEKAPQRRVEKKSYTSLEDFTREIFGELSGKQEVPLPTQQAPSAPFSEERSTVGQSSTVVTSVFEPEIETAKSERQQMDSKKSTRVSTRPELGASRPILQREKDKDIFSVPTTKEQLVQAIIASEILSAPKSRQNRQY